MTPYPGTPQFARMEAEGRLLHRDWTRFDTAHAVFRPEQMSPERLEQGHAWLYRMFFSSRSFWARRPTDSSAVLPYRAVPWLYKRSHPLCRFLIQRQLTHAAWSPLVRLSRHRHLRFRRQRPALDAPSATLSLGLRPGV